MLLSPIYRTVRARIAGSLRAKVERYRREKGLPPDLGIEEIKELAQKMDIAPIKAVTYDHVSSWKRSGAYRLYLQGASRTATAIYKNSIYDADEIAALDGLPAIPGPSEYVIYECADGPIGHYLPNSYLSRCNHTGRHYQYLLEDLAPTYERFRSENSILSVSQALPELYRKMDASIDIQKRSDLPNFDQAFSEAILSYAEDNLQRYIETKPADVIKDALSDWKCITQEYMDSMEVAYNESSLHLVHGDLNVSNLHFHNQEPSRWKAVDWEWTGIGGWWFDLVTLLKTVPAPLERESLEKFFRAARMRNGRRNQRIYQWAKLQRGLFDASFFAKQRIGSTNSKATEVNLDAHILRAVERARFALLNIGKLSRNIERKHCSIP